MDFIKSNSAVEISLLIGILGFAGAYLQYRKAQEEARSFRQQLIAVLHHAEGISAELQAIGGINEYSNVQDLKNAVNAIQWNAQSLFFGLVEAKVGGKAVKDELDDKYKEWSTVELSRKIYAVKHWLEGQQARDTLPR